MDHDIMQLQLELQDSLTLIHKNFAGYYPQMSEKSIKYLIDRVYFLKRTLADIEHRYLLDTQKQINQN